MREVYASSRGEGFVAGIIPEPDEVLLCLAVRDDEEQAEQFTLNVIRTRPLVDMMAGRNAWGRSGRSGHR